MAIIMESLGQFTLCRDKTFVTIRKGEAVPVISPEEKRELLQKKLIRETVVEPEEPDYLSAEEIQALRRKDEILQYATIIGLTGLEPGMSVAELKQAVMDFCTQAGLFGGGDA